MRNRLIVIIILLAALLFVLGCTGSTANQPVLPAEKSVDALNSHGCWGVWQFVADPEARTLEMVPLRGSGMHLNAIMFLEPPPLSNLTLEWVEFNGNIIEVDIGMRHPFLGLNQFTGFDVCGILITGGSVSGFEDSDIVMAGEGDTRLLNPDGYSRWWNPAEFPVNEGTMKSYNDGLLGVPYATGGFTGTVNAYKYFCDELDIDEPIGNVDPSGRGIFSAGQKNVRKYIIEKGGGLVFNYAIDACWKYPSGDPPWMVPDDFGAAANRNEAWRISVTEISNTLYNDGDLSGGDLYMSIDVYDWFDAGMNSLLVESPGNFDAVAVTSPSGGGVGYSTYAVEIIDANPISTGLIDILISVVSENEDFQGFITGVNTTAYFIHPTTVSTGPVEMIYVDDSNDTGVENGSMQHPYDTIPEGLAAALAGWEVWVDDSGNDYEGPITLADNVTLKSVNWDNTDGTDMASITAEGGGPVVNGADNATIEGFKIHGASTYGIQISGVATTIRDCWVDDIGSAQHTYGIRVNGGMGSVIEGCEISEVHTSSDWPYIFAIYLSNSPITISGCTIHHIHSSGNWTYNMSGIYATGCNEQEGNKLELFQNEIHDIYTHGLLGGSYTYPHGIYVIASTGAEVTNNLIYSITAGNYWDLCGVRFDSSDDIKFVNNTIHDMQKTHYYGTATGVRINTCLNFDGRNNIINYVHKAGGFQTAYGVRVGGESTVTWEYSDVYNSGTLYSGLIAGTGCISANPLFVNPVTDPLDFHLLSSSPCVDTGDPDSSYNDPDTTRNDMGCYGGPDGNW